ncbi:DUF551 domain-containing protein [Acinetobacter sp. 11367]|nr:MULTISPECIES: DUF551 domain-containing protein [Acinetobacter]KQE74590.1 hypothetical protein APB92_18005 [Acinetobacter pittii]KQE78002.1 hypothetical protein APB92_18695 [Acinetobacter pittii]MDR0001829.1 DUF551 domain-containing protein [Acinetobacter sp. 11367]OTM63312.1 hypothetical protein B9X37_04285 [Acinetobacter pittii]
MTDLNKLRSEFESIKEIQDSIRREQLIFNTKLGCYTKKSGKMCVSANWTNGAWFVFERKAKAQAVPEWIYVDVKLPEIADASVLAHFQNGSIETVHIEDWFKDITSGFDEAGNQTFTKWYLKASNTITHWMPLPEAPIETGA